MSFEKIIEKYRNIALDERHKGHQFEQLMKGYLKTDKTYAEIKKLWLWSEFPYRWQLGKIDIGIDLVAITYEGEYLAIQCKFYKNNKVDLDDINSFIAASEQSFKDHNALFNKFSKRIFISTTNNWTKHAENTIKSIRDIPITRISLDDLNNANVDWNKIDSGIYGDESRIIKTIRPHQEEAISKTIEHFKTEDRAKLIMACGTGKTFTSLKIVEQMYENKNKNINILFLVPSIALLSQALREWYADTNYTLNTICVCSDSGVNRDARVRIKRNKEEDEISISNIDLPKPASTDVETTIEEFKKIKSRNSEGITAIFSTYQSIDIVIRAQRKLKDELKIDLIICDEAHRTTGAILNKQKNVGISAFTKVHYNDQIKADKRLYMSATPRIYAENAKKKADLENIILCSMDDEQIYGKVSYALGFGKAVEEGLLTDYKVMILTLDEEQIKKEMNEAEIDLEQDNEIIKEANNNDILKIIGCINALSKEMRPEGNILKEIDPDPMLRAVAFCDRIENSKAITELFNNISKEYNEGIKNIRKPH